MDSTKLHARIRDLKQKIARLLVSYGEQQQLIQQLQEKNMQLMQQVPSNAETTHDFPSKIEIDTIAKKGESLKDWEDKIDRYISEIDKSIAYLENIEPWKN